MSDLATLQIIQKDLQLEDPIHRGTVDHAWLKTYLTEIIRTLLDENFERLLTAMYRIDVDEKEFKKALNSKDPDQIPSLIANLIIERESRKVASRKKYRT